MTPLSPAQLSNAPQVYDIETPLEAAVAAWFTVNNMAASTTNTLVKFQNTRPRVDIEARVLRGTNKAFGLPNGQAAMAFNATFRVGLMIGVLTGTSAESKVTHAAYRAQARLVANTLPLSLNIPNHTVNGPITDNGTVTTIKTEEGYQLSVLSFEFDLAVRPNSWNALTF